MDKLEILVMVDRAGFEPATSRMPSGRSYQTDLPAHRKKLSCELKKFCDCPTLDGHQLTKPQPLNSFYLPVVALDATRAPVTTGRADPPLDVVSSPPTASTTDVHDLVALAHRWSAFDHFTHSAGEMKTTESPRITIVP